MWAEIRTESADALKYWFGVSTKVVWRWRSRFGITRTGTPGSEAAHLAASRKGAAGIKAKDWTDEELDERAERAKKSGRRPPGRWDETGWTSAQLGLLGSDHDEAVAKRIGRSPNAVTVKRTRLKIPAFSGWVTSGPGWTAKELALLGTADDEMIAAKVGRTAGAVRQKRNEVKIPTFREREARGGRG